MIFLFGILLGIIGGFRFRFAVISIAMICAASSIYYVGPLAGRWMLLEVPSALVSYVIGALGNVWLARKRAARRRKEAIEAQVMTDALLAKADAYIEQQRQQSAMRKNDDRP